MHINLTFQAFRKPETSLIAVETQDETEEVDTTTEIIIHHSNDREPLPLALHHTPLSVTLGIIKALPPPGSAQAVAASVAGYAAGGSGSDNSGSSAEKSKVIFESLDLG